MRLQYSGEFTSHHSESVHSARWATAAAAAVPQVAVREAHTYPANASASARPPATTAGRHRRRSAFLAPRPSSMVGGAGTIN